VEKLIIERSYMGTVMGSLEGWLGIRSVRTLEVRVLRQSESAAKIVAWIHDAVTGKDESEDGKLVRAVVKKVEHASLQTEDIDGGKGWLAKQMPNGFGPVFSVTLHEQEFARRLPSKLHLFHHATSLGGVESLIEWRTMTDASVERELLRISIGVEGYDDLRTDLLQGFKKVFEEVKDKASAA
jgi:cystathionine beta-lyase